MKERKLENYHTAYKYIPKERLQAVLGLQIIANELQVRLVCGCDLFEAFLGFYSQYHGYAGRNPRP